MVTMYPIDAAMLCFDKFQRPVDAPLTGDVEQQQLHSSVNSRSKFAFTQATPSSPHLWYRKVFRRRREYTILGKYLGTDMDIEKFLPAFPDPSKTRASGSCFSKVSTMASPMPLLPPVTRITLLAMSKCCRQQLVSPLPGLQSTGDGRGQITKYVHSPAHTLHNAWSTNQNRETLAIINP